MVVLFFGDFHPMVESIEQKHLTLTNNRSYIFWHSFQKSTGSQTKWNSIRALEPGP